MICTIWWSFRGSAARVPILILLILFNILHLNMCDDDDCTYTTCQTGFRGCGSSQEPCAGTGREFVRDVQCADGNTVNICCRPPYRIDKHQSRQMVLRMVTTMGDILGRECTKRVFCVEACRDGVLIRYDYPQLLPDDPPSMKEYVDAYQTGESLSCLRTPTYPDEACEKDCQRLYPTCDDEMDRSVTSRVVYLTGHMIHSVNMWSFDAAWLVVDTLNEDKTKIVETDQAVMRGFGQLSNRMQRLVNVYHHWKEKAGQLDTNEETQEWNQFLIIYNSTDSTLVEKLYKRLDYQQFADTLKIINGTVAKYDS